MPPDIEAIAEQVFTALADPTRRTILAALASGGPATATDLAAHLPITRQAIAKHLALLAEVGLVTAEPGERRRVRYRLRSAPMQAAQQFLAALAAGGPATATDLAARLPITRQAIAKHLALLAEAGLVTAEPGERRRVRYRLRSAPMQVAQQFLAALARDWDSPLGALKEHLDRGA